MKRQSLDSFDLMPDDMRAYLRHNGWHMNKKMCEFACRQLKKKGKRLECWKKEDVDSLLMRHSVELEDNDNYDYVFVCNMALSDYYNSSIEDESHLALFVKDLVEDDDQADGFILHRFYADSCIKGIRIPWEDVV